MSEAAAEIEPVSETAQLKLGYHVTLTRLAAFEPAPDIFEREEEAYFWAIDQALLRIPPDLSYENLKESIQSDHRERMKAIWDKVIEQRRQLEFVRKTLIGHWEKTPPIDDKAAERAVDESPLKFRERFRKGAIALIAKNPHENIRDLPAVIEFDQHGTIDPLTEWQTIEKALRDQFYNKSKDYITALRSYYEMLLERKNTEGVLSPDDPNRPRIVVRNRYLRVIDAARQGVTIAKAGHHEQGKDRLRKVGNIPYVNHVIDVVRAYIFDVIAPEIEKKKLSHLHLVVGVFAAALHDLLEDTHLNTIDLKELTRRLADIYDSRIDQAITSGFGNERHGMKRQAIDLLNERILEEIIDVLKILSKNINTMPEEAAKRLFRKAPADTERMTRLVCYTAETGPAGNIEIDSDRLAAWKIQEQTARSRTFQEFQKTHDPHMDLFLLKLYSTDSYIVRDIALLIKMEDRANNMETIQALETGKQLRMLRATITRLISWVILDRRALARKSQNPPGFARVIKRLVDNTQTAYATFQTQHSDLLEECDARYIEQLGRWKTEVDAAQEKEPSHITEFLTPYREAKAAA